MISIALLVVLVTESPPIGSVVTSTVTVEHAWVRHGNTYLLLKFDAMRVPLEPVAWKSEYSRAYLLQINHELNGRRLQFHGPVWDSRIGVRGWGPAFLQRPGEVAVQNSETGIFRYRLDTRGDVVCELLSLDLLHKGWQRLSATDVSTANRMVKVSQKIHADPNKWILSIPGITVLDDQTGELILEPGLIPLDDKWLTDVIKAVIESPRPTYSDVSVDFELPPNRSNVRVRVQAGAGAPKDLELARTKLIPNLQYLEFSRPNKVPRVLNWPLGMGTRCIDTSLGTAFFSVNRAEDSNAEWRDEIRLLMPKSDVKTIRVVSNLSDSFSEYWCLDVTKSTLCRLSGSISSRIKLEPVWQQQWSGAVSYWRWEVEPNRIDEGSISFTELFERKGEEIVPKGKLIPIGSEN